MHNIVTAAAENIDGKLERIGAIEIGLFGYRQPDTHIHNSLTNYLSDILYKLCTGRGSGIERERKRAKRQQERKKKRQ